VLKESVEVSRESLGKRLTVFTKNQCLTLTVSASKKKAAPAFAWAKKSAARVAIHLKMENPAPDLSTKSAITCCRKRPTITVGLRKVDVSTYN